MNVNLFAALSSGPKKGAQLRQYLGVSQPTLSRLTSAARNSGRIGVLGRGRSTRYALLRSNRGLGPEVPVHRVSASGAVQHIGTLITLEPTRFWFTEAKPRGGGKEIAGLPWFMLDLRPTGFVAAQLTSQWPDLSLPERAEDWTSDQALLAMARRGEDMPGDLLIGEESLARWLAPPAVSVIKPALALLRYVERVTELLAGRSANCWLGGEQPKFCAVVGNDDASARRVIVKFSGLRTAPAGKRWANLLLAEHLASEVLREQGRTSVVTAFYQNERRAFLEIQRFDRVGLHGRQGAVSLRALQASLPVAPQGPLEATAGLLRSQRISNEDAREIRWRAAFCALIGNGVLRSDDVSFISAARGTLRLAPIYDMLPMIYAPLGDDLPAREFLPPSPLPACADQWRAALPSAISFWQRFGQDARATLDMRVMARENAARLQTL